MAMVVTFGALGEPTRLRIVELLRRGRLPVGEIAERLAIRQPQASKHLRVLHDAGLVTAEQESRHRFYALEPTAIEDVGRWVASFEQQWETRLDALGDYLAATERGDGASTEPTTHNTDKG